MAAAATEGGQHSRHHELGQKIKHPFHDLKDKLNHSGHLHDAKVHLIHEKYALTLPLLRSGNTNWPCRHKIGKFANLVRLSVTLFSLSAH